MAIIFLTSNGLLKFLILTALVETDVLLLTTHSFLKQKRQNQYFSSLLNRVAGKFNIYLVQSS